MGSTETPNTLFVAVSPVVNSLCSRETIGPTPPTSSSHSSISQKASAITFPSVGSPGEALPFYYGVNDKLNGTLPSILVSGDYDGFMYMFDPTGYTSPDGSDFNWVYNEQVIMKTKQFSPFVTPFNAPTVGQPTIADIDGDGCNDIVVPSYYLKQLVFLEQKNKRNCATV